jgi:hypothetical protein
MFSLKEALTDPIFQHLVVGMPGLSHPLATQTIATDDHRNVTLQLQPEYNINIDDSVNIEEELKPKLMTAFEHATSSNASRISAKCLTPYRLPYMA